MRRIQHVANPRKFVAIAGTSGLVSPPATHTCGWLTHGRFLFFARAKKRNQKKARPGAADIPLRFSPAWALANSPAAHNAARLEQGLAQRLPRGLRCSAAATGIKTSRAPFHCGESSAESLLGPYGAPEAHRRNRGLRETFDRARGAFSRARRVRRAPIPAVRRGETSRHPGSVSLGPWARAFPGAGPTGALSAPNFAPGKIVLSRQDKFDGIEFGQAKPARRARAMDGPSPRTSPSGARTRFTWRGRRPPNGKQR